MPPGRRFPGDSVGSPVHGSRSVWGLSMRMGSGGRLAASQPGAHGLYDRWQHRDEDDGHYQQLEVLLHEGKVSEEEAYVAEDHDPECSADGVEGYEMAVVHLAHTCDEGGKGPDYRHEAGEDDGLAAVFAVEFLCPGEVALPEYPGIRIAEQLPAEKVPYHVVAGVAEECRREDYEHQQMYVQRRAGQCGYCSCDEQQRVSRKEGGDHEAGFAENDQEQDGVGPEMVLVDNFHHVLVDVEDEVDYYVHAGRKDRKIIEFRKILINLAS